MDITDVILQKLVDTIGEDRFELWFGRDPQLELDEDRLLIRMPNALFRDWVRKNLLPEICEICRTVMGHDLQVTLQAGAPAPARKARRASAAGSASAKTADRAKHTAHTDTASTETATSDSSTSERSTGPKRVASCIAELQTAAIQTTIVDEIEPVVEEALIDESVADEPVTEESTADKPAKKSRAGRKRAVSRKKPVTKKKPAGRKKSPGRKKSSARASKKKSATPKRGSKKTVTPKRSRAKSTGTSASAERSVDIGRKTRRSTIKKQANRQTVGASAVKKSSGVAKKSVATKPEKAIVVAVKSKPKAVKPVKAAKVETPVMPVASVKPVAPTKPAKAAKSSTAAKRQRRSGVERNVSVIGDVLGNMNGGRAKSRRSAGKNGPSAGTESAKPSTPVAASRVSQPAAAKTSAQKSKPSTPVAAPLPKLTAKPLAKPAAKPSKVKQQSTAKSETPGMKIVLDENGRPTVAFAKPQEAQASAGRTRPLATFSSFVDGQSNHQARFAAEMAVQCPGQITPLYIYGPTSVGKSHLLEAIHSEAERQNSVKTITRITAEQFTTEFLDALRGSGLPGFRRKYRNVEMFLLDDVQFFRGKRSTLAELLYTLDSLLRKGRQVIITGDRPLDELRDLGADVVTRLEGGMPCEMKQPELELRLGITRQMAVDMRLEVPDEVCRFIASRFSGHARQLAGALCRLKACSMSLGEHITLDMAHEVLEDLVRQCARVVRLPDIERAICETFGLERETLHSKRRAKTVSHPRMLAMWLARKYTRNALSEIGRFFGGRSHSTVATAKKKVDGWLDENAMLALTDRDWTVDEAIRRVEQAIAASS